MVLRRRARPAGGLGRPRRAAGALGRLPSPGPQILLGLVALQALPRLIHDFMVAFDILRVQQGSKTWLLDDALAYCYGWPGRPLQDPAQPGSGCYGPGAAR